jgi:hypothetical protein
MASRAPALSTVHVPAGAVHITLGTVHIPFLGKHSAPMSHLSVPRSPEQDQLGSRFSHQDFSWERSTEKILDKDQAVFLCALLGHFSIPRGSGMWAKAEPIPHMFAPQKMPWELPPQLDPQMVEEKLYLLSWPPFWSTVGFDGPGGKLYPNRGPRRRFWNCLLPCESFWDPV